MQRTRIVRVDPEHRRQDALNGRTLAAEVRVALHRDRGTVSPVCLGARPDRINATVMGRHAEADLFVTDDPAVSLRHLVVLTHPLSAGTFRVSVLDLRTQDAFWDEQRRRCEAITCRTVEIVNVLDDKPACPGCKGAVTFYNKPALRRKGARRGSTEAIFSWKLAKGRFTLPDTEYRCPRCGELTLRFHDAGVCWN